MAEQQPTPQQPAAAKPDDAASQAAPNGAASDDVQALQARAAERDKYLELARRTQADFENYQRRNQREREQERRLMLANLVRDMLPVLDNLERALAAAREAGETGPLVQGVTMVQSQFLNILGRYGVKAIDALGKPFDHNLHEAVAQQPAPDQPPNTVVQVLAPGFVAEDRVLRPAKVVVSAPAEPVLSKRI
jgi:molecular chaperone GrpE